MTSLTDAHLAEQFASEHGHRLCWRKQTQGPLNERAYRWFARNKMGHWHEDSVEAVRLARMFLATVTADDPALFGTDASEEKVTRILKLAQKHLKPSGLL